MLVTYLGEVAGRKRPYLDSLAVGNFLQEQDSESQTVAIRAEEQLARPWVKEDWGVQVALLLDWDGRTSPSEEGCEGHM